MASGYSTFTRELRLGLKRGFDHRFSAGNARYSDPGSVFAVFRTKRSTRDGKNLASLLLIVSLNPYSIWPKSPCCKTKGFRVQYVLFCSCKYPDFMTKERCGLIRQAVKEATRRVYLTHTCPCFSMIWMALSCLVLPWLALT